MPLFTFLCHRKMSLINNAGVWPDGCRIAPFYGRLNPEQVFFSVNSASGDPSVQSDLLIKPGGGGGGDLMSS
jgi:hypothetical protein